MNDDWLDEKPWIKRHPVISVLLAVFVLLIIFGSFGGEGDSKASPSITGEVVRSTSPPVPESKIVIEEPEEISEAEEVENPPSEVIVVSRIIDGDTLELSNGEVVRLICIDTPERGQEYYGEAADYLGELVLGKEIFIEKDVSERDKYQRLLRYIYVDGMFVNKKMVADGYAKAYPYEPDTKHCPEIQEVEEDAREAGIGIWEEKEEIHQEEVVCQCEEDLDCKDFQTRSEAQNCYEYCMDETGTDFHRLDGDEDEKACESLPAG